MNKVKQASAVIVGLLCLATLPATAQNKGRALGKAVEATVGRKVAQQTVKNGYNPVFGYRSFRYKVPGTQKSYIKTTLQEGAEAGLNTILTTQYAFNENLPIQTAPILNPSNAAGAFVDDHSALLKVYSDEYEMDAARLTQAFYLWRLAHQREPIEDFYFTKELQELMPRLNMGPLSDIGFFAEIDRPTYLFLNYLLDPNFTPKSFAKLVKETPVYPKHITLNAQGFPEPLAEAKQARILDIYLMQSEDMSEFYNAGDSPDYTPFTLTKEEQQAARQLKELRAKGDVLPENPTPRQLLENIYNQLERQVWPYHDERWMEDWDGEIKFYYFSYFPYSKTPAGKAIRRIVEDNGETAWQRSFDNAHLMVVDAIINKHPETLSYYNNLLGAFKKLWTEAPRTANNIRHLKVLQRFMTRAAKEADGFEGCETINAQADKIANLKLFFPGVI